jgi:uncharacterized membrane protein YcaP (DUF421 family)
MIGASPVIAALVASVPASPSPISASGVGVQVVKTVIVIVFLLVGFRLFGKREMAQLSVYDLAMLFALSNAVQNAMTGGKGNLVVGLATSAAVLITAWLLIRLFIKEPRLETRLLGSPSILVRDGQILVGRMRRERVGRDELAAAIRGYGLSGPDDVALAVLEVDGSISIIPKVRD